MRYFLIVLSFFILTNASAQTKAEKEKIKSFKEDVMAGVTLFKADTLITSTALITRAKMLEARRISTFPLTGGVRYDEYYYSDTKIPQSTSSYVLPEERLTGVSKYFNKKGELEYTIDHDKGVWDIIKADNYPYHKTLMKMKKVADSLLIASYGTKFFTNHIRWTPLSSHFYDGKTKGSGWVDYEVWAPKRYLVNYAIRISDTEFYNEQIDVQLDSTGRLFFPFGKFDDIKGFERMPAGSAFVITKPTAIEEAVSLGLLESEDKKAFTYMSWKYIEPNQLEQYNGKFVYNVAINTRMLTVSAPNRRGRSEYKFDVYVFNPWTGEFIEKQKMKSHSGMEKGNWDVKDLQPDN